MITSLIIKNIATYDHAHGVTINDLKRVNFFFGFNGSGKSTIANYLRDLTLDVVDQNPIFSDCSNIGYDSKQHQILTFCEKFTEVNFKKSPDFKGVFSLNQANEQIDIKIKAEETSIKNYEAFITKCTNRIDSITRDKETKRELLLNHCWNQRTSFKNLGDINLVHSGSKPNHFDKIQAILQNPSSEVLSIKELFEQYKNLYEKDLKEIKIQVDTESYFQIRRLENKLNQLLFEVIVGKEDVGIAELIQKLNSRSWVEQGTKLLQPTDSICPFCQNETIDQNLREQFENYFDETYKGKIKEIKELKDDYSRISENFSKDIKELQKIFNPENIVSDLAQSLTSLFDDNLKIINYKIEHSNEKKTILSLNSQKTTLSLIINRIKQNNELYNDLDTSKEKLIGDIWNYMAENCSQEIKDYGNKKIKYKRILDKLTNRKSVYDSKITLARQNIESLRSQTVNTKDAVDKINIILKNAGFEGFEIAEKDTVNNISRYFLKRPNSTNVNPVFDSLSEGEKNFISFLYFYQLCLGTDDLKNNSSKKKIIVIDDPVSSLDSQALFIVSTLIHSLIQRKADDPNPDRKLLKNTNISQVLILTHNIYFYKEVSFDRRPICTDYWHYKISKLNNKTSVTGNYNKTVFDDYSLMWQTLRETKAALPNNPSLNIMISNAMRRIIESYISFVGYGNQSWGALSNEDQTDPSYYIKCAFISTINDESHKTSALDSAYYQKIIHEQPQILFDVFSSIFKKIGQEHYEMMMEEKL